MCSSNEKGFEVFVDVIADTDYDDSADFSTGIPGVSDEDNKKVEGFIAYASTTCGSELPTE